MQSLPPVLCCASLRQCCIAWITSKTKMQQHPGKKTPPRAWVSQMWSFCQPRLAGDCRALIGTGDDSAIARVDAGATVPGATR